MADDDLITGWRAFNGGDNRDMAHSHLLRARQEDPEKAAKQAALAQRWGVGVDTARAQQETLERQAKVERDQQALTSAPKVAAWLAKTFDHAAVSHDHIPDMATVEQVVQQNTSLLTSKAADSLVARGPVLSEARGATPSVGSYLSGLGRGFAADAALAREGIRTALFDLVGDKTGSAEAQRRIGQLQWRREMSAPDFKTKLAGSVFGGVQSTLGAIPAIGAGVATRNPAVTLSIMGGQTTAPAYGKYRERGGTPGEASLGAGLEGGIEVLTEMIPMGIVVNQLGKAGVKDFLARFVGAEVPTEQAATLLQDAVDTAIANPDKTWGDFWRERPEAAFDTLVASGVMAGGLGAVHTGMRRLAKQDVEAEAAPARLKAFNEVAKATTALPLRERAPAAFEALVQELTPGVDVHVNAQAMATYLQSVEPEEADALVDSLGIREQLDAATPEQDIVIPAAKYLQHVAPTETHKVFEQDIRLGPGAMSVREAEEHKAEREQKLAEIAGRVLLRGNEIAQVEDPVERVRQHFYEQARAVGIGEEQAKANAAVQAAYYAQRAERNKSYADAWAAYEAANISMKGQGATTEGPRGLTAGGATFDQTTETPEFKTWFANSKVVDKIGKPLVVYHGMKGDLEGGAFDPERIGDTWSADERGFFFISRPKIASEYASGDTVGLNSDAEGANVVPAYVSLQKPLVIDDAFLRSEGMEPLGEREDVISFWDNYQGLIYEWMDERKSDGVILRDVKNDTEMVVATKPTQIKSVFNEGSFSRRDPRILKQGPRGQVTFSDDGALIELFKSKNVSTLVHEGAGHIWLENLARDAADPNASDEVRADLERVKDWWRANAPEGANLKAIDNFGKKTVKTDDIRPFHELFARAAERYFMEGKAPTPGLRNVFAKFRNWLVSIYKDFTKLNVPMTDDIRGVFDRMIAGDAALADAQEEQALTPALTPEAAQKLGMSEAEYAAYLETVKRADEASQDRLLGKLLSDIRRKYTDAWKTERAGLVEEYQAQVDATPEMQALTLLETGTRLQRDAVADVEARLYRRQRPYVFDDGLHPDVIADQVGLPSGQALVDALLAMKEEHDALRETGDTRTVRRARAENLADAEMLARHGDILNDGTIGDEAIAALNETRRSEVLMSEVRALVRKAGETTAVWTPAEMAAWATQQIAKRKLADIRPHIFAVAEAKAGRDALKALVTDDFPAALDAKFRQLLNMYLYRAARDARETVDKGKTLFDRIATARNGTIAKSRNMDMVSAARAIIAAYGFGSSNNDADYMTKVAQYDPELWADLRDGVTAAMAGAKPVDDLTLDEFDSLHIMVDQLWRMSRTSRQMQIEFEALELEDITNDLGQQLGAVTARPNNRAPTNTEHAMRLVSGLRAALRRVESWVEGIDGGRKGPWRTYVWQPVSEAATRFRAAKADYQRRFVELLEPIQANMRKGKIDAPELGYTFGYANSGVGKGELLHALLHTGNASNKRKLLLGRGWAVERPDGTVDTSTWDRFVDRMHAEGVVTAEDWTFIQGVWDLLEETKPDAQRAHRQVFGRYFEEVTAEPFTNRFGTFRGGYVPAIVDTFLVQEQALNLEAESITNANDATMFPSPARGFTKARVEYNKPLALDLGLLPQHIDKVLKFSHMTAPVRDVLRLLKEKSLSTKLEAFDPVAVPDLLLPWLHRSAKQMVETPSKGNAGKAADNFFRAVRTRTGMGIMIGNVINTLQQLTGWLPATLKVRKRFLTSALFRVTMDPAQVAEDIATMSPYMATRITAQAHEAQQQIEQLLLDPTKYEQVSKFAQKHAYILQSMTQNIVDTVTWQAAFEQAVVDGDDFADAVRFADSTIRQTQGSLAPEDVSRFETGSPFMRMFTQFYNYFGAQSNLLTTEFKNAPGMTRVGYVYIMGILLPAVVAESIRRAFGAGWDDEDDDGYLDMWLDVFFGSQFRYVTGMVPVAGPMLVNMANQLNQKPYDDTITPAPAFSSAAQVAGIPKDVYKLVTEGTGQKRTVRDTATLLTLLTGIPWFNAAARPLGYLADVNEGKVEPTSELDLARGLITGSASAESKQ